MNNFALDKNYSQFNFEEISVDELQIISGGSGAQCALGVIGGYYAGAIGGAAALGGLGALIGAGFAGIGAPFGAAIGGAAGWISGGVGGAATGAAAYCFS